MSSTLAVSHEAATRARWGAHYRNLMAHELVTRTLSLRFAMEYRGGVEDGELRLQTLEAEQARRATWVMAATADPAAARMIGTRPF